MRFLRKHAEGALEGDPSYMYGVVEGCGGTLWPVLCYSESEARKLADELDGSIVIVASRILENEDGDSWPLPVRTRAIEEKESADALEESRVMFEEALKRWPKAEA